MAVDDLRNLVDEGSFVSIDIEGDGNNPPSPVEVAAVLVEKGHIVGRRHWLVNPGRPMSEFVQEFHGITDEMLVGKPAFREIEQDVRALLTGATMVAHRASEDLRMLRTVMPDVDFLPETVIDTQRLARNVMPGLERYRLSSVCEAAGLSLPEHQDGDRNGYHTALTDAEMTARLLVSLSHRITDNLKQRRHMARSATVIMSPKEEARLREALLEAGIEIKAPRP